MKNLHRLTLFVLVLAMAAEQVAARKKSSTHPESSKEKKVDSAQVEAATRLQVFLDRANFSPGPVNGRYGEFTIKALTLYRQSIGEQPSSPPPETEAAPDVTGLDLASVGPAFVDYTVTDNDLQNIGSVPGTVAAQAKVKFLPYRDAAEAIAEKFHCDVHFLAELNPGKTKTIKPGDQLRVPNVEPFELAAVKDLEPGAEISSAAANDVEDENDTEKNGTPEAGPPPTAVKVDTKTNMLEVFDADKLVAAYPVTIGSSQTATPIGEWNVRGIAKLPRFRYDKEMLNNFFTRSSWFYLLKRTFDRSITVKTIRATLVMS